MKKEEINTFIEPAGNYHQTLNRPFATVGHVTENF